MKIGFISRFAVAGVVCLGLTAPQTAISGPSPVGLSAGAVEVSPLVTEVKKKGKGWKGPKWKGKKWKGKNVYRGPRGVYVRSWRPRPHYGNIVAGVALGTIIGVAIAGSVPPAPSPDLCWYWTNPAKNKGYWDYCY